ncbi:MAG: AmmeMemoRadiSam system radical SAM enzyme [Nitrospinota bacterium]|nr:AmmeMemoRadiSam system radical SAM enzyme [Nitrospinota bacterium]MDH5679379.1 AmmeMemoRadiSam system radical SAM enzyme [Nitrospinota bacterium]
MTMTAYSQPHPASHWAKSPGGKVRCLLCPFNCALAEGKTGICKGKTNIEGELVAVNYGRTTSLSMDPMEKKPLYHFLPGTSILSIGPNGCNLRCDFCQNYHISQGQSPTQYISPQDLASIARKEGAAGVAYTYSEPLIWFEYVMDAAQAVRARGMVNVLVSNGFINPAPLAELLPWVDAMNLDIKSMDPSFYKKICKSALAPVLETARAASGRIHLEITNLIIPGLNDSEADIRKLVDFIADLNDQIPLHFSRYFPTYKRTTPPTPPQTLAKAAQIASEKLKYVFVGNLELGRWSDTICPGCSRTLIHRSGYRVGEINLLDGNCMFCGHPAGVIQ